MRKSGLIGAVALALSALALAASGPAGDGYGNAYPTDEVFARIARHEAPAAIAWEDPDIMVFATIAPASPGHMLVIARNTPARSIIDMDPALLARMMAVARRVAIAQRDALGAKGAMVMISNGNWQAVPHLHIHVVPKYDTRIDLGQEPPRVPLETLTAVTARIGAAMGNAAAR